MKRSSLIALFIVGLLIGSSSAFANFGSNKITSGSFILKGVLTSGGQTVTSASFSLLGGISFGGAYPTSASYRLIHQWPALLSGISVSGSLTETPAPTDIVDRLFTGIRDLTETPTVSDALARVFTGFRATSEDLASSIVDSISKSAGKFLLEAPPISDVVDRLFTGFRDLTESPTVSDALARIFTGFRATSEDLASSIVDSISKSAGKFLSEAPPISDLA